MKNFTDGQLVDHYLKGTEKALEVLIGRYLRPIYGLAYRYAGNEQDAEDITQETFVKTWRNLKKFDRTKKFKTWVFSIAKNTSIDFLKKKKALLFSEFENEEGENLLFDRLRDSSPLPMEISERKDAANLLVSVLKELSVKQRTVLFLRYNSGFNFREIAGTLNEPLHTVKSRHRRALITLRKLLIES